MSMEEDGRFRFLFRQVSQAFRSISAEHVNILFVTDNYRVVINKFLDRPDVQAIFFRENKGLLEVSDIPSKSSSRNPVFYVVKLHATKLTENRISEEVIYGDIAADPLEHMASLAEGVYAPIVSSKSTPQQWSETVSKDVKENFESFVANVQITQGHVRGVTCLPLPNAKNENESESEKNGTRTQQSQVHTLESAIITWTKQIKNVLKQDPEVVFVSQTDPGPLAEVEFWKSKATNLNGIFDQLQSLKVRKILKLLDRSKSTYNSPFAKLCKEVFHGRSEANNIVKYLRPLVPWFTALENEADFVSLGDHFRPILHLILLVWKSSVYYNTPSRLVILIREICNTLIRHATVYLDGDALFGLIDQGETTQAVKMLQTTLKIIGKFKATYFEYKSKSMADCPDNPWRVPNSAIFVRLDLFLERCHDILDLSQIILLFSKLSKIEVGGTKGKILTTSVAQIFSDFTQSVEAIRSVGSGILDLTNKEFENAFYEFRTSMKVLDRRLGSVVVQGFDDTTSVGASFKLLHTFDNLVSRPIIADELDKKHVALIESVKQDLEEVQRIFLVHKDSPPVASNLPPIAGALTWCRGLLERVQGPLEKLKSLDKKLLERDDSRDVMKIYTALVGQLAEYDKDNIGVWGASIEAASQAKLKNPLLRRIVEETEGEEPASYHLLCVNFDQILVKLLREVKYFVLLGLQVPSSAMEVYQRAEVFRRHTGNLDLIVNMYNDVQTSLLPVERPLVKNLLDRIDKTLSLGVGEGKNKAKALNWKSNGIEVFISETMTEMKDVSDMLLMLKSNLRHIEITVQSWRTLPVFERASKPMLIHDFLALQKKVQNTRVSAVKEAGQEIHRLLKDTNKKLKISQGLPDWKSYVEFVNNVVVDGLIEAVAASIRALAAQLNAHPSADALSLPPLLEIQADLINKRVVFIPEVGYMEGEAGKIGGIKNMFASRINGMLGLATAFKRLDTSEGSYTQELYEASEVLIQRARVAKFLDDTEINANKLKSYFKKFEYLWLTDLNADFELFLEKAVTVTWLPYLSVQSTAVVQETIEGVSSPVSSPRVIISPRPAGAPVQPCTVDARTHWAKTNIDLDQFAEKIKIFLDIQVEISEFKTMHEVDYLKVNTQLIKQSIATWATKWLYVHSQYLQIYVRDQLTELHTFLRDVNKGLDVVVESGDRDSMMEVMRNIRDVRKRTPQISSMFDPLRAIVFLLKNKGVVIDIPSVGGYAALDFLEQAKMFWESSVNKTYRVKESLQPMMNGMLTQIFKEVKNSNANVGKFLREFKKNGPFSLEPDSKEAYASIFYYQKELFKLLESGKSLNELEDLFELPLSTNIAVNEVQDNLITLKGVWDVVCLVDSLFSSWKSTFWVDLKTDILIEEVKRVQLQLKKHSKKPRDWVVFKMLETNVKNMAVILPLLHDLRSPAMRERHWKCLMAITCTNFDRGPTFCLDDLLALNLHRHVDAVSDIVEVTIKELKIENRLTSIQEIWRNLSLTMDRHRDTEVFVVSTPDDVLECLEEHHLHLQAMSSMGKFVDFFRDQVMKWQTTLGEVETTLKLLLLVERQWGSLESIFLGSADIRSQLPDDTKRFEVMDNEFKEMMMDIQNNPGVVHCCSVDGREGALRTMTKELEKCERALNEYLEIKKNAFPRFYFVSNASLLDILSNGNCPPKIMTHIGSIFDGIGDLDLCMSASQIKALQEDADSHPSPPEAAKAMIAKDKESVTFPYIFEMKGAVENWLNELVRCMQHTLKTVLSSSLEEAAAWEVGKTREEWIFTVPGQIALVTSQVMFTEEVEDALEELESGSDDALKKYNDLCAARLEGLIRLVQGDLSKGDRVKIITVITIDVHNRDVVSDLMSKRVENSSDFKWQSQMRYYWLPDDSNVNIRICDFATAYSYEYTGNCSRLVITPLTDRCYVTLTVALRLQLGGAPAGPAGTGKTETTKDLARGLGLPCYVFNCSDQMNYQSMWDIFKGLTQSGSWGCFDEFNRIEIEVLSVVASQVRSILNAIALYSVPANRPKEFQSLPPGNPGSKVGTFMFFGDEITLIPTVGLFVTMNPGYAGRTELPENLKALFRSCAMIQPDLLPIAENMLMAEGFVRARPLSVKFVTLYKLAGELLSKQNHYDWGLRAIKSVLRVAGVLKRADPELEEEAILMRALRDFNTPKIPSNDIPIFIRLISDLFPGLELPTKGNTELHRLCVDVCKANGLQPDETFISKVLQYQELLDVRHSVMLLGPGSSGKTTVWKTLAACHNHEKQKQVTVFEAINPKSINTDELYGYMTLTKDWRDGVLSIIMRDMTKNSSPFSSYQTSKWVVLDGDIDAGWIESMNTVMDDNKVLTLVSNERIPLSDSMRLVFEIDTLKHATPATVSRAGILYLNDTDVGYQPFLDSWLGSRTVDAERQTLPDLFDRYLSKIIEFILTSKIETYPKRPVITQVQSFIFILEGLMKASSLEKTRSVYERLFVFAAIWGFGGSLSTDRSTDSYKLFSTFIKGMVRNVKFPDQGDVLDFYLDPSSGEPVPWSHRISGFSSSSPDYYSSNVVVPTAETVRLTYFLKVLVKAGRHVMFIGPGGTGKTVLVGDFLSSLAVEDSNYRYAMVNMNYYTDSASLQRQLEDSIDKISGKTYGPPNGQLVYFVDDLSLPQPEKYGTQTPHALMRQHMDQGSWYDRSDVALKKNIINTQYVCCMNPKSGGGFICPRLQQKFVTFSVPNPSETQLQTTFGSIITSHLYNFHNDVSVMSKCLTDATIAVHKEVSAKFPPSGIKFLYNFSMRDVSAVFKGLLFSKPENYKTTKKMTRLWYHEVMRVYSDRLATEVEVARCREIVVNIGKRFMEDDAEHAYSDPCVFAHFLGSKNGDDLSNYMCSDDGTSLKTIMEKKLAEYNEGHAVMNLVLFEKALHHLARISRILVLGHALLVGVGGSGKQSLAKLAAFVCQIETVQLSVTTDYSITDLKEQLKEMFKRAAVRPAEPLLFILADTQIIDERFLVPVNDLLSTGRVRDLFTKDEYDSIFSSLRAVAKGEGVPENRDSMMDFFTSRIRKNLHLALCFSPVGELFRQRTRRFPGIINGTCIDMFHEWPKDALVSVAQRFLLGLDIGGNDVRDNIAYHMAEVHTSVGEASANYLKLEKRHNYTTPKSYLELVGFYKSLLVARKKDLFNGIRRLDIGLDTLNRTNKDVAVLAEFLIEKKKEVEAKKAATDVLLEEMGRQRSEAETQQGLADVEKNKADRMAAQSRKLEEQAAGDLASAKPALDAANNAVNCLDKASMTELKSFVKPPPGVDKVTTALLIMIKFEKKNFTWENAKKMMAKLDSFLEQLEHYKGEDIPQDVINRVLPIIDDPEFTFERMKTKSAAAANLCNWVVNIIRFNSIYKRVKPLMDSLDVASKSKRKAEEDLALVNERLSVIEGKLAKLQAEFMAATQEKGRVESEAKDCSDRLSLAERLTTGLATEKDRWAQTVREMRLGNATIAGDVMLAAAFTSYIGAFGASFRQKLWKDVWLKDLRERGVPFTANVDPLWVLASESKSATWQTEGLPSDRVSLENGAVITTCTRWPLLIDPQMQGLRWLKKHAELQCKSTSRRLHLLHYREKGVLAKIVSAIQAGDTVILENIGEVLDASLDPVLSKAIYRRGKSSFIKIGEDVVEYDESFRFFLQTKLSNPHYRPEVSAQCTLINFIVTKGGLEDQLLSTIVSVEEPALEETRTKLVLSFNTYKIQLEQLEDRLLERIANAPTDILSDTKLIEGLEATKETVLEVKDAVARATQTGIGINQAREAYRVVATEASLIYFVMLQLSGLEHMYKYSLDGFTLFFLKSLHNARPDADKTLRVRELQSSLRVTIVKWMLRGLFEKHRLTFLTLLIISLIQNNILPEDCGFSLEGLRFLLLAPKTGDDKSPVSWISDSQWNGIKNLSALDFFGKLPNDIEENSARFLEWFQHFTPESEKLPGDFRELEKFPFRKMLIVRILRPDRMTSALTNFIRDLLPNGKSFVECDSDFSSFQVLEQSFEDTTPLIPLYFLLSPGSDVASDMDKLALKCGMVKDVTYFNISLGQGQDVVAAERLEAGSSQGFWIFLNNIHLMPKWLVVLEKKLDDYAWMGAHPDFRVMLSSDPSTSIPVSILDRAIKVTSDPPSGLKANLKQAFTCFSKDTYEELEPRTKGILFGLCQFHAVLVERKKFGSKGFNMLYPFSIGDLVNSSSVLKNYMESAPAKVPWLDLRYLFGEIMYGGHIINDFDRTLASTYMDFFMREELLDEMVLYPHPDAAVAAHMEVFRAPSTTSNYEKVLDHIEEGMRSETPVAFGMHPNAEIGFRTQQSDDLISSILSLSAANDSENQSNDSITTQQVAEAVIQDVQDAFRDVKFELALTAENIGLYQFVLQQECEYMNILLFEIMTSLTELNSCFKGDLTMTDSMEELAASLHLDRVPRQWALKAYPSQRPLGSWLADLQARITQLTDWIQGPGDVPLVTWISGLFNPQSFLTAVMQATAQSQGLELDKLTLVTEVTRKVAVEEVTTAAKDGTYIIGLYLEGAAWSAAHATLESSKPREMFHPLPVINIRPAVVERLEAATYHCPVYKTQQRGSTYVFSMQLKTKLDRGKWTLAGVAAIMDVVK